MLNNLSFEKSVIYPELSIIREKNKKKVIGYVHKIPSEGWIWFSNEIVSKQFNDEKTAIEELIKNFSINHLDNFTNKNKGIIKG